MKKFLGVLSAFAIMAMGSISVSAESIYVDPDNIIFSSSNGHVLIDKDGRINRTYTESFAIIIKMKDNSEPVIGKNLVLEKEDVTIEKLSKYQKAMVNAVDTTTIRNIGNIELTDNIYVIRGFANKNNETTEYSKKLLEENENVEYAEPVIDVVYKFIFSGGVSVLSDPDNFNKLDDESKKEFDGIDFKRFSDDLFLFSLSFENTEQAESFDVSNVEGFEEKLSAKQVVDSKIYFQFTDDIDRSLDMGYMLDTLKNTETVKSVDFVIYGSYCSTPKTVKGIPESYAQGDVNCNGKIDLQDAVSVAKHLVTKSELDEVQEYIADFDENDKVDLQDVIGIAKSLL